MNTNTQKPNLPSKNQSASVLIWLISGFYLLAMVWLLLIEISGYGEQNTLSWLVPTGVAFTVCYGILMSLLWPNENVPKRLVR
jgi:hypothetical protein